MHTVNLTSFINEAKNMVEIESIIMAGVSDKYMNLFTETERKFDSTKETQDDWIISVDRKYHNEIIRERLHLFSIINERFHNTVIYLRLKEKFTYRVYKIGN